jgi:TIR domain
VVRRLQGVAASGTRYFADVVDLEPGERWERRLELGIDECDLFLLFWSRNAKSSDWVKKEALYARRRQHGDELSPPEIRPVCIERPIEEPWPELAYLHFNDVLLYLIAAEDESRPPG